MEIENIINILLEEHREYCTRMFQKCENAKDFREFAVRADTVRIMINKIINKSFPDKEMRKTQKNRIKERIDNVCELIFLSGGDK